jgi:predicted RNA binding protein YcfA (HicA-like mRNA interferase family)
MAKVRKMRVFTDREFKRILDDNGYRYKRSSGDHQIYVNATGRHISVKYPVNPCISRRLIKEYELKVEV